MNTKEYSFTTNNIVISLKSHDACKTVRKLHEYFFL